MTPRQTKLLQMCVAVRAREQRAPDGRPGEKNTLDLQHPPERANKSDRPLPAEIRSNAAKESEERAKRLRKGSARSARFPIRISLRAERVHPNSNQPSDRLLTSFL